MRYKLQANFIWHTMILLAQEEKRGHVETRDGFHQVDFRNSGPHGTNGKLENIVETEQVGQRRLGDADMYSHQLKNGTHTCITVEMRQPISLRAQSLTIMRWWTNAFQVSHGTVQVSALGFL